MIPNNSVAADDLLLQEIAQGQNQALQSLMLKYAPPMLCLAERIVSNSADADEIVQEAFVKTWQIAGQWQSNGKARFSTWLYRVVLNAAIDRKKRKSFLPLEELEEPIDESPGSLEKFLAQERQEMLSQAINDLPLRQKEALMLCFFGELSQDEAALVLDISLSALEALLIRGKRGLKKILISRGITGIGDVL